MKTLKNEQQQPIGIYQIVYDVDPNGDAFPFEESGHEQINRKKQNAMIQKIEKFCEFNDLKLQPAFWLPDIVRQGWTKKIQIENEIKYTVWVTVYPDGEYRSLVQGKTPRNTYITALSNDTPEEVNLLFDAVLFNENTLPLLEQLSYTKKQLKAFYETVEEE
jgi:hypothetical protein